MRFFADLHIHSRYSRATSPAMSLESLWRWAQMKGITVIGTGDFTHPKWLQELKEKLYVYDNKLFKLKDNYTTRRGAVVVCVGCLFRALGGNKLHLFKKGKSKKST